MECQPGFFFHVAQIWEVVKVQVFIGIHPLGIHSYSQTMIWGCSITSETTGFENHDFVGASSDDIHSTLFLCDV